VSKSFEDEEKRAQMVDVSGKGLTERRAVAWGFVRITEAHKELLRKNPKGDVFAVAQVAGIQAAKKTWEILPLCHPIPVSHVSVSTELVEGGIKVQAEVIGEAKTGVEMEALVAVAVASLAIYDMLKSAGQDLFIEGIQLLEKTGGKTDFRRER
jgi:cyclic pyranopterin phosphate synthase